LGNGSSKHLWTEIGADNARSPLCGPIVGESQIPCACTEVEDRPIPSRRDQFGRPPAPVSVNIETEDVIEQIVARRNGPEHAANANLTFVNKRRAHRTLRASFWP